MSKKKEDLQEVVSEEILPTTSEVIEDIPYVGYNPTPEERVAYITSVKMIGDNYFVNGSMTVPPVEANSHYQDIKIWLSLGNTPEPQYNDKELNDIRIGSIKAKAGEIINSRYPAYKQLNASLGVYTKKEVDIMVAFIKDIRDQSTKLEKDPTKTADDFIIGE